MTLSEKPAHQIIIKYKVEFMQDMSDQEIEVQESFVESQEPTPD